MHLEGTYRYHMSNETCIEEQEMSESVSHNHAITFQASEHCKGPYSKKPWRYNRVHGVTYTL